MKASSIISASSGQCRGPDRAGNEQLLGAAGPLPAEPTAEPPSDGTQQAKDKGRDGSRGLGQDEIDRVIDEIRRGGSGERSELDRLRAEVERLRSRLAAAEHGRAGHKPPATTAGAKAGSPEPIMVHIDPHEDAVIAVGELLSEDACARFGCALDALRESPPHIATVDVSRVSLIAQKPIDLLFTLWLDLFRQGRALHLVAPDHVWDMLGEAAVNQALSRRTAAAPAETGHPDGEERGGTLWRLSK